MQNASVQYLPYTREEIPHHHDAEYIGYCDHTRAAIFLDQKKVIFYLVDHDVFMINAETLPRECYTRLRARQVIRRFGLKSLQKNMREIYKQPLQMY